MPDNNTLLRRLLGITSSSSPTAIWAQAEDNTLLRRLVEVFQNAANSSFPTTDVGYGQIALISPSNTRVVYTPGADTDAARGVAFTAAYTAAASGDVIQLGPGVYNIGNFHNGKAGLSIIGSGALGPNDLTGGSPGTVLEGSLTTSTGSARFHYENFTVRKTTGGSANVFTFQGGLASNWDGGVVRNVSVIEPDAYKAGQHIFELNGTDVLLDGLRTYGAGSGSGHGFSIKSVARVRVLNCSSNSSGTDGLLIVGDPTYGNLEDVVIQNFVARSAQGYGVYVNPRNTSTIDRLVLQNVVVDGCTGGLVVGDVTATASSNTIRNSRIQTVIRRATGNALQMTKTAASALVLDVDIETSGAGYAQASNDAGLTGILRGRIKSANGEQFFDSMPIMNVARLACAESRFTAPTMSIGVTSGEVRAIEATSSSVLYVVLKTGFDLATANISVGDPIWIEAGTAAGVHKFAASGTVSSTNVPIAGAVIGDFYVELVNNGLSTGAKTVGSVRPGKAVAKLVGSGGNADVANIGDVWSGNSITFSNAVGRTAFGCSFLVAGNDGVTGATTSNIMNSALGATMVAHCYPFVMSNEVYLGIFAGHTNVAGWVPSTFGKAVLKMESAASWPTIGWVENTTLP